MSCISRQATKNISARITPRSTKGTPRLACWAMKPPATEPVSIATPLTIWPRANTESSSPMYPVACSASTTQASTAPEKKVKPSPISSDTSAHCQTGASTCQSST